MSSIDVLTMFPPGGTRMTRTTGPTTASVKCNICHRSYSRKDVLQRHIRMKHEANTHLKKPKKTRRRSCIRCAVTIEADDTGQETYRPLNELTPNVEIGQLLDKGLPTTESSASPRMQTDYPSESHNAFGAESTPAHDHDKHVSEIFPFQLDIDHAEFSPKFTSIFWDSALASLHKPPPRNSRPSPSDHPPETDAVHRYRTRFDKTASPQSSHSSLTSRSQTGATEVRTRISTKERLNGRAQVWDQSIWTPDWESSQISVVETLKTMTTSSIVDESIISSDEVETYWGIYFSRYNQTLPILHKATLSPTTCSPLLLTTITAIGASYVSTTRAQQYFVTAFGGVCNLSSGMSFRSTSTHGRVLPQEDRFPQENSWDVITALSLTYHHIVRSCNHGFLGDVLSAQGRVVSWAKHMELLTPEVGERSPGKDIRTHSVGVEDVRQILESQDAMALEDRWLNWSICEQRKRVTWAIIVLHYKCCLLSNSPPRIASHGINLRIPCPDNLWEAPNPSQWKALFPFIANPPRDLPVHGFLRQLLQNENLVKDSTRFNKIIAASILEILLHDSDKDGSLAFDEEDIEPSDPLQLRMTLEELQRSLG
ncbi:hypothetical protein FOPE_03870 [Fonsecaea pedrosoi]|nr:hypothetical protein FOPE_03870 [Fonsecaea pedrosoi]